MNTRLIEAILTYGRRYRAEYLSRYSSTALYIDPWLALQFFFGHACYQGRLDIVSEKVEAAVISTLSPYFSNGEMIANYETLRHEKWRSIERELLERIGPGKVGKRRDVRMVLSTLEFLNAIPDRNIVRYSVDEIRNGSIARHFADLQSARNDKGITQVGPKIAAFYLRDIISLFALDEFVTAETALYLQPVDVWVRKLAQHTQIVPPKPTDAAVRDAILLLCKEKSVSPLLFNQGAWYLGIHAFDLLIEVLN